ncbi:hypothetical protein [Bradyrhizobium sp. I1.7.5]|uniref:hypothetical protein n=1 Tax=Bradyrhizobium sp. I1.7.5 TaxID=3156363 RepID=UPI003395CDFA
MTLNLFEFLGLVDPGYRNDGRPRKADRIVAARDDQIYCISSIAEDIDLHSDAPGLGREGSST